MGGKKKGGNQGGDNGDNKDFKFDFGKDGKPALTKEQTAALMPILQQKLDSVVGKSSGYLESLPAAVQTRVRALKHLQSETDRIEEQFRKEEAELQKKYQDLKAPLFTRRSEIVNGKSEPKAEELVKKEGETVPETTASDKDADVKGVPDFWLIALQHNEDFAEMISEDDEGALKHLIDVTWSRIKDEPTPTPSFTLNFHFSPNDYFTNEVLSKTYELENDMGDVMLSHVKATEIDWKQGKNLTVKIVTKQQKTKGGRGGKGRGGKNSGPTKSITSEEPVQSFFRFFQPEPTEDEVEDEQELQDIMESDYDLGLMVRDHFIPNAVMFFTGEMPSMMGEFDGEDFGDDEDDDEDGEGNGDEEEYNSEEDEDFDPKTVPQGQQPECKQQ